MVTMTPNIRRGNRAPIAAAMLALSLAGSVCAQGLTSTDRPAGLEGVGIDQKMDAQVPLDLPFVDEDGHAVRLGDFFGKKPILLTLVYYECPMLCTEILNGVLRSSRTMELEVGNEFDIVTVSIDPGETPKLASDKKAYYARAYGRAGAKTGWHFLTGAEPEIERLADAVGFRYRYDPATDLYSHASSIFVLTPEGHVSRYFFGVEYSPRDLRLAMVEASRGEIGTVIDQALLYCFHYDPATGQYSVAIMNVLRLAGAATVLAIVGFIALMIVRERRSSALKPPAAPAGRGA